MKHANFLYTSELEGVMSTCFKALESSNYDVRVCVAQLIGTLMAMTQQIPSATVAGGKNKRTWSLEEVFSYMSGGFLRGGIGFLKGNGGELLKSIAPREVRVGVTQVIHNTNESQDFAYNRRKCISVWPIPSRRYGYWESWQLYWSKQISSPNSAS